MIFNGIYKLAVFEKRKGKRTLQTGPWKLAPGTLELFGALQFGPWPAKNRGGHREGGAGQFPARRLAGGEGPLGEKEEEVGANL